jgi:hypothetical protein
MTRRLHEALRLHHHATSRPGGPASRRLTAAITVVLMGLSGAGALHQACPHHDPAATHGDGGHDGGRHGAASTVEHAAEQAPEPHGASHEAAYEVAGTHAGAHDETPAPCTCIGTCHGSAAATLTTAAATAPGATPVAATAQRPAFDRDRRARTALRLLPFANGPPASLLSAHPARS